MGPTWVLSAPAGPHVGPMNLVVRDDLPTTSVRASQGQWETSLPPSIGYTRGDARSDFHYNDVTMGAIASEITSLAIVYSTVYSDTDQRKHQSSASLAFVRAIHRWPVNSPHIWPVTKKSFYLMTSSCDEYKKQKRIGSTAVLITLGEDGQVTVGNVPELSVIILIRFYLSWKYLAEKWIFPIFYFKNQTESHDHTLALQTLLITMRKKCGIQKTTLKNRSFGLIRIS